ncbi:MAG: TonB-dependent receptor [Pseudomonadota bacterium]
MCAPSPLSGRLSGPLFKLGTLAAAVAVSLMSQQAAHAQDDRAILEEVLVTASRREESLQDTSLIISALSSDDLQERGITNMVDLAFDVPSLQVGAAGPALQLYIRGVGTDAATGFSSPGIAVSKDSVYIPRVTAMGANFFDLARVEVLQGPQGTLYGRNATGGAVNLITNGASLGETSGYVMGDVGNYSKGQFEGAINLPISDTFAARIAGFAIDRDGYMSDDTGDDSHWAGRISTLWAPSDSISWRVQGQFAEYSGRGPGATWVGSGDAWESILSDGGNAVLAQGAMENNLIAPDIAFPWIQNAPVVGPAPTPPFPPGTNLISLVDPLVSELDQDLQLWDVSTTFEWDLDFADLTIVGAYQDVEQTYLTRTAVRFQIGQLFGQDEPETSETFSLEARLSGDTESLQWVAGVNVFEEDQSVYNAVNQGIAQNLQLFADINTEALGLFGQVTYSVSDRLRLIAGLRYSDETQEKDNFNRFSVDEAIACPPQLTTGIENGLRFCRISGPESGQSISDDSWDWKAGVEYDVTEDTLVFFTASTGFKAGGLPAVSSAGYGPEELLALSLGMKNLLLDGRLQLNGDLFYWEYDDKQENLVGPDAQGIIGLDTVNAGESTIQGVAMDIKFAATGSDFLTLSFEYLDATYDDFSYFQGAALTPPTTCPVTPTGNNVPGPAGPTPELFIDCSGFDMTKSPELVARASYTHTFDLGSTGELDFHINMNFTDERWLSANFLEGQLVDSFTFWNAHLAYRSPNSNFSALAYIRNIGEEESFQVSLNHTQVPQLIGLVPGPPETYGLQLRYAF